MAKAVIPNIVGHYEMSGIEVDVNDKQIVIRHEGTRKEKQSDDQDRKPQKKDSGSPFGPITTKLLGKIGLD
jgi:hypothetical protein